MIIGVTGDTHNNLKNIKTICSIFNQNGVDLVLHTGDVTLPKSLNAFKDLNCPLIVVLGNNDIGEREGLEAVSSEFKCSIFEEPFSTELNQIKISVVHHPDLIDVKMLKNNDLILHGHTHRYRMEEKKGCLIFNPGECAGFLKNKNKIGIIDLQELVPKVVSF